MLFYPCVLQYTYPFRMVGTGQVFLLGWNYDQRIGVDVEMRAKKVDENQAQIVQWYKDAGYFVVDTHSLGQGFPDILVVSPLREYMFLVEIKSSDKEKLTDDEQKFHDKFPITIPIVYDYETFLKTIQFHRII